MNEFINNILYELKKEHGTESLFIIGLIIFGGIAMFLLEAYYDSNER